MKRLFLTMVVLAMLAPSMLMAVAGSSVRYAPLIPQPLGSISALGDTTYAIALSDSLHRYIEIPSNTVTIKVTMWARSLSVDTLVGVLRVAQDPTMVGQVIDTLSITATNGLDTRIFADTSDYWGIAKYIQLVAKHQDQHTAVATVYNKAQGWINFYDHNGVRIGSKVGVVYQVFYREDNND